MTGSYTFLPEFAPLGSFDVWEGNLGDFTHVFGHSFLGHLFLWSPAGHYGVAYPYLARFKDYGAFDSPAAFQAAVLEDPYVRTSIFREGDLPTLADRLGPVTAGQVYYPVPYEFLGGSGALETYDKGDLLVWASIVGQAQGLHARPTS